MEQHSDNLLDQARRNILIAATTSNSMETEPPEGDFSEEDYILAPLKQMVEELSQPEGGRILNAYIPIHLSTFSLLGHR